LLENHRDSKTPFDEGELLLIADDLITGLSYFQSQGISHGDIRPFNIFHRDQVYKLSDPSLNAQKNSNGLTQAIIHGQKTLLSPELIPQVPTQNFEITADRYKSDVYSLGATLLALATLTNSEDFYDYEKGTVNETLVRERLNNVRQNYSEFTHDLIEDMLTHQEGERPDSVTLANKVGAHKDFMRRAYQGRGVAYVDSRTNVEERVKRANLPTEDGGSYKAGSIEELEARIRAAILRTEETFRLVKATPGLSGVYRTVEARHSVPAHETPGTYLTSAIVGESGVNRELAKSQVGQDYTYSTPQPSTYAYNYTSNVGTTTPGERVVRTVAPSDYVSTYVPASTYAYDVAGTSNIGTTNYGRTSGIDITGLAGNIGTSGAGLGGVSETRYSQHLATPGSYYGTTGYTAAPQGTTNFDVARSGLRGSQFFGTQTGQAEQTNIDALVNKIVDVAVGENTEAQNQQVSA